MKEYRAMGCRMVFLRWLSEQGYMPRKGRLLDMGESCLLAASPEDIQFIHDRHGGCVPSAQLANLSSVFARRSRIIGDPVVQTLFLSEVLELTDVEYVAFDIVAARKAELFDLNIHNLAPVRRNSFDLVVNFGTTAHVFNQFNAFKVAHEATGHGGYLFHRVPLTGFVNHGYFSYKPLFFRELAEANNYETVAFWCSGQSSNGTVLVDPPGLPGANEASAGSAKPGGTSDLAIPDSLISVLFRKVYDYPFRVGLEVATSAGALRLHRNYESSYIDQSDSASNPPYTDTPAASGGASSLLRKVVRRIIRKVYSNRSTA